VSWGAWYSIQLRVLIKKKGLMVAVLGKWAV